MYTFQYCSNLTCITIPEGLTSIGSNTFMDRINLIIYCEATSQPEGFAENWNLVSIVTLYLDIHQVLKNNIKY